MVGNYRVARVGEEKMLLRCAFQALMVGLRSGTVVGTLSLQRALFTGFFGKVNGATGNKGHLLSSGALDNLLFPVQNKSLLVKMFADPNGQSFAIDLQPIIALTHQMTT